MPPDGEMTPAPSTHPQPTQVSYVPGQTPGQQVIDGQHGALVEPGSIPQGKPGGSPRKSNKPLIISVILAGTLLLAAAIATPFVIGNLQHTEAVKEYDEASEQLSQARTKLAKAVTAAATGIASTHALSAAVQSDRVADPEVVTMLEEAVASFEVTMQPQVDALTESEGSDQEPAQLPETVKSLRESAELTRVEAEEILVEAEAIETANQELWEAQLKVVDSVKQSGEQLLLDAAEKADAEQLVRLQNAVDALNPEKLVAGESHLEGLIGEFNQAWDAVQGSLAPVWEDINGEWCHKGTPYQKPGCQTIVGEIEQEYGGAYIFSGMKEGCFHGKYSPNGPGGAQALYCPAGVPTPAEYTRLVNGEPVFLGDDESRDRMWGFQGLGAPTWFRQ